MTYFISLFRLAFGYLAVILFAVSAHAQAFSAIPARTPEIDGIVLTNSAGISKPLSEVLPGKPAVIHFWATWCAPCRTELPEVAAYQFGLDANGKGEQLIVVAVDAATSEAVQDFVTNSIGLGDFATWHDANRRSGPGFALFGMPSTMLLDAKGDIVGTKVGPLRWVDPAVKSELDAHLVSN